MLFATSITDPRVVAALADGGGVGILPTDTIYGIVASAANRRAVERLYETKKREGKPGTVIAASQEQLVALGLDAGVVGKVAHLWPNPVSIVIPAGPELRYLDLGLGDIAVRVPADAHLRELLEQTGPLLTSSANQPGEPPSFDVSQAQAYFDDQVDFYVDGGERRGQASTVVRYRDGQFETLRPGPIAIDQNGRIM